MRREILYHDKNLRCFELVKVFAGLISDGFKVFTGVTGERSAWTWEYLVMVIGEL